MLKLFRKLYTDDTGATAIEYGLIAALISVAAIIAMQTLGGSLNQLFTFISDELKKAAGGS